MKKFLFAISIFLAGTISVLADEVKYSSFYLSYSDKEYNVLIENDLGRYASVSFDVDNMEYGEYALVKIYINRIDQFIKSLLWSERVGFSSILQCGCRRKSLSDSQK